MGCEACSPLVEVLGVADETSVVSRVSSSARGLVVGDVVGLGIVRVRSRYSLCYQLRFYGSHPGSSICFRWARVLLQAGSQAF